jgi:hypothetical protein
MFILNKFFQNDYYNNTIIIILKTGDILLSTIKSNSNLILRSSKYEFNKLSHEKAQFCRWILNIHYLHYSYEINDTRFIGTEVNAIGFMRFTRNFLYCSVKIKISPPFHVLC